MSGDPEGVPDAPDLADPADLKLLGEFHSAIASVAH